MAKTATTDNLERYAQAQISKSQRFAALVKRASEDEEIRAILPADLSDTFMSDDTVGKVESLLTERDNLEKENSAKHKERRDVNERLRAEIANNDARIVAIELEIHDLLPTNPVPPMRVGL